MSLQYSHFSEWRYLLIQLRKFPICIYLTLEAFVNSAFKAPIFIFSKMEVIIKPAIESPIFTFCTMKVFVNSVYKISNTYFYSSQWSYLLIQLLKSSIFLRRKVIIKPALESPLFTLLSEWRYLLSQLI